MAIDFYGDIFDDDDDDLFGDPLREDNFYGDDDFYKNDFDDPSSPHYALRVRPFIDRCNEALNIEFPTDLYVRGEVSSFKISQNKWVFFDLKDDEYTGSKDYSINCFMFIDQLNVPLEDGMKVIVRGHPSVTRWGKLSFTAREIMPIGEGSIKKGFDLLKEKLTREGLFDPAKKRPVPDNLQTIGIISSTSAAGYADFIKILNERWGGMKLKVAHTQVQGLAAVQQIIRALQYFNERGEVEVITILRGGGSADDLAVFNDERLVRAIAASRIPVVTGIGHEVDETLSDLAADLAASTPSNAAQMLSHDRRAFVQSLRQSVQGARHIIFENLNNLHNSAHVSVAEIRREIHSRLDQLDRDLAHTRQILEASNPDRILSQGYAIISGKLTSGNVVKITTFKQSITAEIKSVQKRE